MHETRALAEYVANAKFEDLPPHVVGRAKELLLDHFGVALLATRTEWGRIALKYAQEFAAIGECTVYGKLWKSSAQHAALANPWRTGCVLMVTSSTTATRAGFVIRERRRYRLHWPP